MCRRKTGKKLHTLILIKVSTILSKIIKNRREQLSYVSSGKSVHTIKNCEKFKKWEQNKIGSQFQMNMNLRRAQHFGGST